VTNRTQQTPGTDAADDQPVPRRWISLAAICIGVIAVFFNITATFTTLGPLQSQLHVSSSELVWVTSAYSLVLASLVLTGGTLGDLLGRRTVFVAGSLILAAGNLTVFWAVSAEGAIAGQAVMGLGAALMLPTSLAILSRTFVDSHQRTQAISLWAASSGLGMAIGPIVAGAVLEHGQWNSVYIIPAIAAGAVSVLGLVFVHDSRHAGRRLDVPGVILATITITALVYGVIDGGHSGYTSAPVLLAFAVAAVGTTVFILVERKAPDPMLDLRLFRSPAYASIMVVGVSALFAFTGSGLLILFLLQRGQHATPLEGGLQTLPLFLAFVASSASGARFMKSIGVKLTLMLGLALTILGSALMLTVGIDTPYAPLAGIFLIIGAGLGLLLAPTTAAAMMSVPRPRAGMASASVNMFRQIGGVLGASVIGTVLTSQFAANLPGRLAARHVPAAATDAVEKAVNAGQTSGLPAGPVGDAIAAAIGDSLTGAIHAGFLITAIVLAATAIPTLLFIPARPAPRSTAPAAGATRT
jgi:MFS family permease